MHGLRFDLRSGLPQGHECERLQVYPVTVTARGEIVVTVHV
jgi:nitrite reductase/ring-hydroxylating ferredoxin subunit